MQPVDDTPGGLPFMPPDAKCNARQARASGYCPLPAGQGTQHEGVGRCRLHGGNSEGLGADHPDGALEQFRAMGLGKIIDLAETMTRSDQEYLMHVGTNAVVVARAKILAKMQVTDVSPKELADLTIALTRLDNILAKYPDDEDPDAAPNTEDIAGRIEMENLVALEAEYKA